MVTRRPAHWVPDLPVRAWLFGAWSWCQRHRKGLALLGALTIAGGMASYFARHPSAFVDLWLTRDQQARLAFERGQYRAAADRFLDQRWRAYSHYAAGDFDATASLYESFTGPDERFSQANALAHAGRYYEARDLYQQLLQEAPDYKSAQHNLSTVQFIIFQAEQASEVTEQGLAAPASEDSEADTQAGAEQEGEFDEREEREREQREDEAAEEDDEQQAATELSHELWLQQVQKNPAFFLRKKFYQQHIEDRKRAAEGPGAGG